MEGADLFCLPAELEPFGLVFLEAMAKGLPVVACLSGAVPEIVLHSVTGLLSYPSDARALAENLIALLRDPGRRAELGKNGRQRVSDHFLPSRVVESWVSTLTRATTA
jgi:phosphatidylinositol alpha-1,6-mannosyltransferase